MIVSDKQKALVSKLESIRSWVTCNYPIGHDFTASVGRGTTTSVTAASMQSIVLTVGDLLTMLDD